MIKKGYDRVTDVLYHFSGYGKIDPVILNIAADRGTKVHRICDALILNMGTGTIEDSVRGYVESFEKWYSKKDCAFIKPDRFYCDTHKITGECDGIYKQGNEWVLFDLKTSQKENQVWPLQGSAYAYLAALEGLKIDRVEFIKLSKQGDHPQIFQYAIDQKQFFDCLDIYNKFFKNMKIPDVMEFI